MTNRPHVAGLILARGGSKGIPLKNLSLLSGKPLLEWALGAMTNFGGFDSLWVSTDHAGIATCATGFGANVFPRSSRFAGPESPSIDAVNEFLQSRPEVDIVALVQCTSPFLRPGILQLYYYYYYYYYYYSLSFCSFLYWVPAGIVGVVGGGLNTFFCYILYNYIYNYIYIYILCVPLILQQLAAGPA
jgi:hypothetical protein